MLIGAHVSIAGGFEKCIERGEAIGANCIQNFASSPRSFQTNPLSADVIAKYKSLKEMSPITYHVFHGVYLINLANENSQLLKIALDSLNYYQETAGIIGGAGTIFHVGSHKGQALPMVIDKVA